MIGLGTMREMECLFLFLMGTKIQFCIATGKKIFMNLFLTMQTYSQKCIRLTCARDYIGVYEKVHLSHSSNLIYKIHSKKRTLLFTHFTHSSVSANRHICVRNHICWILSIYSFGFGSCVCAMLMTTNNQRDKTYMKLVIAQYVSC